MLFIKLHFPDLTPNPSLKPLLFLLCIQVFLYYIHRRRSILSLAYQCFRLDKLHLPASQMLQIERTEENEKTGKQDARIRKLEQRQASLPFHHTERTVLIVCGLKKGWRLSNTIGLDSMAEYSLSLTHTKSKSTNFLPKIAGAAFKHEITLDLPSSALFSEPSAEHCSFEGQSDKVQPSCFVFDFCLSASISLARSHATQNFLADAAALVNRRTRRGATFVHPAEGKRACDHREGRDDSLCFQQRASCPWRPPLTHEYLARQLTVIGYCCEPSGLVCAHCPRVRQHTTVASHPAFDGGRDGFKITWNK